MYILIIIYLEYYLAIKIGNTANMDGPGGHYVKWNQRNTNRVQSNLYVESKNSETVIVKDWGMEEMERCQAEGTNFQF